MATKRPGRHCRRSLAPNPSCRPRASRGTGETGRYRSPCREHQRSRVTLQPSREGGKACHGIERIGRGFERSKGEGERFTNTPDPPGTTQTGGASDHNNAEQASRTQARGGHRTPTKNANAAGAHCLQQPPGREVRHWHGFRPPQSEILDLYRPCPLKP